MSGKGQGGDPSQEAEKPGAIPQVKTLTAPGSKAGGRPRQTFQPRAKKEGEPDKFKPAPNRQQRVYIAQGCAGVLRPEVKDSVSLRFLATSGLAPCLGVVLWKKQGAQAIAVMAHLDSDSMRKTQDAPYHNRYLKRLKDKNFSYFALRCGEVIPVEVPRTIEMVEALVREQKTTPLYKALEEEINKLERIDKTEEIKKTIELYKAFQVSIASHPYIPLRACLKSF